MDSKPTFQTLVSETNPNLTSLQITKDQLDLIFARINYLHSSQFRSLDASLEVLNGELPKIGAQYRKESARIDKKLIQRKLSALLSRIKACSVSIKEFLPNGIGDPSSFIADVSDEYSLGEFFLHNVPLDFLDESVDDHASMLGHALVYLGIVEEYAEGLLKSVEALPSKRGQRGMGWYDRLISTSIAVANLSGIKTSTQVRSSEIDGQTPFITLVMSLERLLPEAAWSRTARGCASRIERSMARVSRFPRN